jgi:alkaline phosphatase
VEVMKDGRTAYMVNDTADATVTESAAAATQIACGVRVPARAVGMGPDGMAGAVAALRETIRSSRAV